jgi:diguanylate cyclase
MRPQQELLPLAKFISLAESTGDIVEIGRWVLQAACLQLAAWHPAGQPLLPVAINLFVRQLAALNLAADIEKG